MWNCLRCGIKCELSLKSLKHSQTHQYENNEQKKNSIEYQTYVFAQLSIFLPLFALSIRNFLNTFHFTRIYTFCSFGAVLLSFQCLFIEPSSSWISIKKWCFCCVIEFSFRFHFFLKESNFFRSWEKKKRECLNGASTPCTRMTMLSFRIEFFWMYVYEWMEELTVSGTIDHIGFVENSTNTVFNLNDK